MEEAAARNLLPVSLESLGEELIPRGIESDELVEALEWLLEQGRLIEVEENEFILE
jgi:hypothetical protein